MGVVTADCEGLLRLIAPRDLPEVVHVRLQALCSLRATRCQRSDSFNPGDRKWQDSEKGLVQTESAAGH